MAELGGKLKFTLGKFSLFFCKNLVHNVLGIFSPRNLNVFLRRLGIFGGSWAFT
jgi:hypothetical protein